MKFKFFMEDYGIPIICGIVGAFIGTAIVHALGLL